MQIYTVGQAAERLSVSPPTVRTWLHDGLLRGSKIGGGKVWRVTEDAIQEFLKQGELPQNQEAQ